MQVNDKVVCVFSNDTSVTTHKSYLVYGTDTIGGVPCIEILDDNANYKWVMCYRFMLESDVIKQVLENARNDR